MGTAAVILLTLMFSTGPDEIVEQTAFFGSMVFETEAKDTGALGITMGVEDPVPLVVLFLALTAALTTIRAVYGGLKRRREQLLDQSGN